MVFVLEGFCQYKRNLEPYEWPLAFEALATKTEVQTTKLAYIILKKLLILFCEDDLLLPT